MDSDISNTGYIRAVIRWIGGALGLYVLLSIAYVFYSMATGEARVTELCNQITPGMTRSQVMAFAVEHSINAGTRHIAPNANAAYLTEARTLGRHTCRVELESGVVKTTAYKFYD